MLPTSQSELALPSFGSWLPRKYEFHLKLSAFIPTRNTQKSGTYVDTYIRNLPIFQITDIGINDTKNNSVHIKKRIVTDRHICEIIRELEKTEWDDILNSDDVNFSYETLINLLIYTANIVILSPVR